MDLSHKNNGDQREPDTKNTVLFHLYLFHSCKVQKQAKLINVVRSQKMVSSGDGADSNEEGARQGFLEC